MRGYFLTNMYLSPIQCGIQSAHCIHDMFITYRTVPMEPATDLLYSWAENHKTMIVLNGGTSDDLKEFYDFMMLHNDLYPFEDFREPGIENAVTVVGVVLPEEMIEAMAVEPEGGFRHDVRWKDIQQWQWDLIDRIRGLSLAR